MTFKHKLSKRLALGRVAAAMVMAACAGGNVGDPVIAERDAVAILIRPHQVAISPGQQVTLTPYALLPAGDSIPVPVHWTATGGTITDDGTFVSDMSTGTKLVAAAMTARPDLVDTAIVQVGLTTVLHISPRDPNVWSTDSLDVAAYAVSGGDSALVDVQWSTDGGEVVRTGNGHGRFRPQRGRAGRYHVKASTDSLRDSVTVTVKLRPVAQVVVTPATLDLQVDQTAQLQVTLLASNGRPLTERPVTWHSNAESIAAVDSLGQVRAITPGTTTVTATSEGKVGTTAVMVGLVPVAAVQITPTSGHVSVGQTAQFTATVLDSAGNELSGRPVSWASDNESVATADANGLVTALAAGTATITASAEGKSASAALTVGTTPVASVSLSPSSANLYVGQTAQFTVTARDADGNPLSGRVATWQSSKSWVASVSANGLVTAKAMGTATITATVEGHSATAAISVSVVPVASVSVTPSSVSRGIGETAQFTATARDSAGNALNGRNVAWSSSDASVATVSAAGLATATGVGTATITATVEGKTGSAAITVTAGQAPVASVDVSPTNVTRYIGQTVQLTATPRDSAGNALSGRTVTWTSSSSTIATVSGTGLVTAKAAGTATITATSEGKSGTASVTVVQVPVASVTVSPTSASIFISNTQQFTATPRDSVGNALTGRAVTWSSSNASVASVNGSGLVTGIGVGTATVSATSEGKSGTATVSVSQASGCSNSLSNVSLPLCDGTYSQSITASTFPAGSVIQAQHPGKVRFTGSFTTGSNLTFRGIVVMSSGQKELGNGSVFEDMSFVGGPSCGNTVNTATGSNVTIRRSAFYGKGGRYQVLVYQQSGVTLEDVIIRSDGGWGQGSGCSGNEPNAALNFYNSSNVTCSGCILFDGITEASSSELLGGLGVNCHNTSSGMLFEDNVTVNSVGAYWAGGNGACNNVVIRNSIARGNRSSYGLWAYVHNVVGTTQLINFTSDGGCANYKGSTSLTDSKVGSEDGCTGSMNGVGASVTLNTTFLDAPRWRQEMCTDAGVTRGWCSTTKTLSEYVKSF